MLEIAVVAWLCWRNGRTVRTVGHSRRRYWLITLALLFGGEIAGAIVGSILIGGSRTTLWALYAFAWVGAILGGAASYRLANRAARDAALVSGAPWEPTHWSSEGLLHVTDAPGSKTIVGIVVGRRLVVVDEWAGERAHIVTAEGLQGWVDGEGLDTFRSEPADVWEPPAKAGGSGTND